MRRVALLLLLAWSGADNASAQMTSPRAGYVYPAGGQRGTTVEVEVGGQLLNGVNGAHLSGDGVRVRVLGYDQPLNPNQLTALRDTVQALQRRLQQSGGSDDGMRRRLLELRDRIAGSLLRRTNPALAERVRLQVTIDVAAAPGRRELRLQTPLGLTAPLAFAVGELPEFREKAHQQTRADAELTITMPAVVNGQLIPGDIDRFSTQPRNQQQYRAGDVDRYRFNARAGQDIVAITSARELMPYLADAVPGWFQATLRLYDASGREVAYADDWRFDPDPVLHYRVPADGEYVLEVTDALYRGREDFVYRVAIGELPYITSVFPLGARAGGRADVSLTGWNLPSTRVQIDANAKAGSLPLSVRNGGVTSNVLPFAVDALPALMEREPNETAARAQTVTLPIIANGLISTAGDRDVYSFRGRAGDVVVAEVHARRLRSPLDAVLELSDASGKRLAYNDDCADERAALETHHADSWLLAMLPADGTYYVRIGDVQNKGGPEYGYRLRISAPQPDFELRVSPSAINVSGAGTVPITVTAIRRDGFNGDITLALPQPVPGLSLGGAIIPAGQEQIRMTLTAPPISTANARVAARANSTRRAARTDAAPNARVSIIPLQLAGSATIAGRTVTRLAIPADDMMQAFAYHHYVAAEEQLLIVRARGATAQPASIRSAIPVQLRAGGSARIEVGLPAAYQRFQNLQFQLSEPPAGITLGNVEPTDWGALLTLQLDAVASRTGLRGNLIIEVSGERPPGPNADPAQRRQRVVLGELPAVPFEVSAR